MQKKMSKMKELDSIAQSVADHIKEIIYHTVEWQIADQPFDGDEFNAIHAQVMRRAIEYLHADTN